MDKNRVILCDFDGTLIHGDLERMFMRFLLEQGEVKYKMLLVSCFTLPLNMLLNKLNYPSLLKSWTFVLGTHETEYIDNFLSQRNNLIIRKEDGWNILQKIQDAKCVLLTGCYGNLIRAYLSYNHLEHNFDEVIATEMTNRLVVKQHPYAKGKMKFVNKDNYNIGIANEPGDHFYLDLCDEQYYV